MSIIFYVILLIYMEDMEKENKEEVQKENPWEFVRFAIIAIIIVIPIRIFIAQPFIVSGASMSPTFENGDYLIVDEISYRVKNPKRFDVIIFRYPNDNKKFFIKRIIGLPNEKINIEGSIVTIINNEYPNGLILEQPYVKNKSSNNIYYELEKNEYFVMGDNRSASSDSRYWGALKENLIIGKAFLRLLPINNIDLLPGHYQQLETK